MSRIVVFGTGSAALDFLNVASDSVEIIALIDNDRAQQGTTVAGYDVLAPDRLDDLDFDYIVIAARAVDAIADGLRARGVSDGKVVAFYPSYSKKLHDAANRDIEILTTKLGLSLPPLGLATMYLDPVASHETVNQPQRDFVRNQAFRLAARQIEQRGVDGAIGELGVYQGDQAKLLNEMFPNRPLYLFDTFTGFSDRDLASEASRNSSGAAIGHFANTSVALVVGKMPFPDQIRIFQGYFPDTAANLDERFAFVSLDVDLYQPTLAGLEWFYKRLNPGGYIFVHDYNNRRYLGVGRAVDQFVAATRAACVPLPDFAGSIIITK